MEMMLQPNAWSCLPTAAAMVLGVEPRIVIEYLQHDGSDIMFEQLPEPLCRQGFHLQEIVDCFLHVGIIPVYIEAMVTYSDPLNINVKVHQESERRFKDYLSKHSGILLGQHKSGVDHAVAWSPHDNPDSLVFDPRGDKYPISEFNIEGALLCF